MTETWKVVESHPEYFVSDFGRVRHHQRILNPFTHTKYLCVCLSFGKRGKHLRRPVAHLVAEAFIGSRPENTEVNYKDANKKNNCLSNLEYLSHKENIDHAVRLGRYKIETRAVGERIAKAKLTADEVARMRKMRADGKTLSVIAREFKVKTSCVHAVVRRKTWKHIP